MLAGDHVPSHLPGNLTGLLVDHQHRGNVAEAGQHPVAQGHDSVAVAPLVAGFAGGDNVLFQIEVLPGVPVPYLVSLGVHLNQVVGPHVGGGFLPPLVVRFHAAARLAALYLVGNFGRDGLQGQEHCPARLSAAGVVVLCRVDVLPDDVAVPVQLHKPTADKIGGGHSPGVGLLGLGHVEEVAVGQQVAPGTRRGGRVPPVQLVAFHVQQESHTIAIPVPVVGRINKITRAGLVPVQPGQSRTGNATPSLLINAHYILHCSPEVGSRGRAIMRAAAIEVNPDSTSRLATRSARYEEILTGVSVVVVFVEFGDVQV